MCFIIHYWENNIQVSDQYKQQSIFFLVSLCSRSERPLLSPQSSCPLWTAKGRQSSHVWLTRSISLKPLQSSQTTLRMWGTRLKILRGRTQRSSISSWVLDWGGTFVGIQHRNTRLTWRDSSMCGLQTHVGIFINLFYFEHIASREAKAGG